MIKSLSILAFLVIGLTTQAQSIEKQVLASGGAELTNGGSINFTIGESVIQSLTNSETLHQGFQHVSDIPISVPRIFASSYSVFPNPFHNGFTIKSEKEAPFNYSVYNMQGQLVTNGIGTGDHYVNLDELATGMYKLSIHHPHQTSPLNFSIHKQ